MFKELFLMKAGLLNTVLASYQVFFNDWYPSESLTVSEFKPVKPFVWKQKYLSSRMVCRWDISPVFLSNLCKNLKEYLLFRINFFRENEENDPLSFFVIYTFHEKEKIVKVFQNMTFSGGYTIFKNIFQCFSFWKDYSFKIT